MIRSPAFNEVLTREEGAWLDQPGDRIVRGCRANNVGGQAALDAHLTHVQERVQDGSNQVAGRDGLAGKALSRVASASRGERVR